METIVYIVNGKTLCLNCALAEKLKQPYGGHIQTRQAGPDQASQFCDNCAQSF